MAWNEPGDNDQKNQNQDPWSGRKDKQKPRDLDDALKKLQDKFKSFLGGKSSGDGGSGVSAKGSLFGGILIVIAILVIWGLIGFYIVQPPERAVVLRFGQYEDTVGPGLHWVPRFIDAEYPVNIQKLYSYTYPPSEPALMLTKDQNIVAVAITVQFRVDNPKNYLFNVVNPVNSLEQATASALRQVVGQMTLDDILTTQRETLRSQVQKQLDDTLSRYKAGLKISNVLLKTARAPDAVKDAFDDAVKAQEDEKRYVNQAQAYAMKVEPIAKGHAKRILEAAKAYKKQVVLQAKAKTAPFLAILPEYKKAPEVTRERLYLAAIEHVLQNSSKILVDSSGTHNLLYLPMNKLLNQAATQLPSSQTTTDSLVPIPQTQGSQTASKQSSTLNLRPTRETIPSGYGNGGQYQ